MTNEAIVLDTLKFIREQTLRLGKPYINIRETIWYKIPSEKQDLLENRLLECVLISLNPQNQIEVELTAQSRIYIEKENYKLEKEFIKCLRKQNDIKLFMENNFIKPNPKSPLTNHESDNGVNFLKGLKSKGMIYYKDEDLRHVSNNWYEDPPQNTKKRWFDTLHQPMLVSLTNQSFWRMFFNRDKQKNIPTTQKSNALAFIRNISLIEWAAICTILAFIVALWAIFFK